MQPRLKICGITRLDDARYCAAGGADYLGFVMHPGSPRRVEPDVVRGMSEWLHGVQKVGVFVDANPDVVNVVSADCGFDLVQLHGSEPPDYGNAIDVPVIKAFRISDSDDADSIRRMIDGYEDAANYFLFDTRSPGAHGGTGQVFNWNTLSGIQMPKPFFLAGGLGAGNVGDAVAQTSPYAIDVSSSVERSPGVKDFDLLSEFFSAFEHAAAHGGAE